MLSLFTTGKPFVGHNAVIQRNALQSWKRLHPQIEIILFGDDHGAEKAARELGLRYESHVERNEWGTKRLDYLFATAQQIAKHDVLCYLNCDIILFEEFCRAVGTVCSAHKEFLLVGRRCNLDVIAPLNFADPQGAAELRSRALKHGRTKSAEWIDYFVFSRGLFGSEIPPFVLRVFWDNWLVWKALDRGKPVIDASRAVLAIHQNHDYGYHPQGKAGVWFGEEASRNARLAGGWRHLRTISDASEILSSAYQLRPNLLRHASALKRYLRQAMRFLYYDLWHPAWFALLALARPLRRALRH